MKHRKNPCPWWRGHAWRVDGLVGFLTMRKTCTRCGLVEVFDGALDETRYYEPLAETGPTPKEDT